MREAPASAGAPRWTEQSGDDLRVECRAAVCDTTERVEELVDVEDAVFQQVAEASRADQFDRVVRFDVLGEEHDPDRR